ncbi:MAG: hypothetical protein RL517_576 [Pseudomonadota bacterium]
MTPFFQKPQDLAEAQEGVRGFILLEVLVAMSLVATSWMASESSYHRLVFRIGQIQSKKAEIKKELDQYEISRSTALQSQNHDFKSNLNESSGMSRRPLPLPRSSGATHQK